MIIEFEADHLKNFEIQPGQMEIQPYLDHPDYGDILMSAGQAYSLFDGETLIACAGLAKQTNSRALAWMMVSKYVKPRHFITITKRIKTVIKDSEYPRIEMIVRKGFFEANRFVKLLGFTCETPNGMLNWFASGETAYLYSVTK